MARYRNHICVANISIPRPNPLSEGLFDSIERRNYIDELVYEKLETQRIEPSATVEEHIFLRRVHQDLIGRLPTAEEARFYLTSEDANKRESLVDSLLDRHEYADHWSGPGRTFSAPIPPCRNQSCLGTTTGFANNFEKTCPTMNLCVS